MVFFSYFVGFVVIFAFPMVVATIWREEYSERRYDWIGPLNLAVLIATTGLALCTYFWVRPYGKELLIAEQPLWVFVAIGVVMSLALSVANWQKTRQYRHHQEFLISKVLR